MTANMHWQRVEALPARKEDGLSDLFADLVLWLPVPEEQLMERILQLAGERTSEQSITAQTLFTAAAMVVERRPNRPLMRDADGRGSDTMVAFVQVADAWRKKTEARDG